jgi:hypothetical protein
MTLSEQEPVCPSRHGSVRSDAPGIKMPTSGKPEIGAQF